MTIKLRKIVGELGTEVVTEFIKVLADEPIMSLKTVTETTVELLLVPVRMLTVLQLVMVIIIALAATITLDSFERHSRRKKV